MNEGKSSIIDFDKGEAFNYLGYRFNLVVSRRKRGKMLILSRPQRSKRTLFLRELSRVMRKSLHRPVQDVVREIVNPRVRGWANYFSWGTSGADLSFVRWQVDKKVRCFASRQRPKYRGGFTWTSWSAKKIYEDWKLFQDYQVSWCRASK